MVIGHWTPINGDKYYTCLHRPDDFPLIAKVLSVYKPLNIIELGTHMAGFSAWLSDQLRMWGGQLLTIDNKKHDDVDRLLRDCPNVQFEQIDLMAEESPLVVDWIKRERSFLYCDNGDKEKEVKIYAKHVPVGGLIGVHDYGTETSAMVVGRTLKPLGFEMVFKKEFEDLSNDWYGSLTRIWVKRSLRREKKTK